MKGVIYARYSSHAQRDESIDDQLRECHEYARQHGITIVGEYIDRALSGKTDNRADFLRMIADSAKRRFDCVVTYTIDRFARNRYDSATYKQKLRKNGVHVLYAKQNIPDNPEGIILEGMLESMAEYYSANLAAHVRRGLHGNAMLGKSTGGTIPLGFKIGSDHYYHIDPEKAPIVQTIFQMYADGSSAVSIVNMLNERGFKTVRGSAFNKNSLQSILTNKKYMGTYTYNNEVELENGVPAIVTKELFEKVQRRLGIVAKNKAARKAKDEYLLTTKLFCGHCLSPMTGESGASQNGSVYHYYKCAKRKKKAGTCHKKAENKDLLERYVVETAIEFIRQPGIIETVAQKAADLHKAEFEDNTLLNSLLQEMKETESALKNLLKAIEQGIILPTTKSRMMELEAQKEELSMQIEKESIKKPFLDQTRIAHWLYHFTQGDMDDIDFRRHVIDALVRAVYITDTDDGKGRTIKVILNISDHGKLVEKSSSIDWSAPPGTSESVVLQRFQTFLHSQFTCHFQKAVHFDSYANALRSSYRCFFSRSRTSYDGLTICACSLRP